MSTSAHLLFFKLLVIVFVAAPSALAQKLPDRPVHLIAKVTNNRFVTVQADPADLASVHVLPGDVVTVTCNLSAAFPAEEWDCTFTWQKTEKRGKTTVKTTVHLPVQHTLSLKWGDQIQGSVQLGDTEVAIDGQTGAKTKTVHVAPDNLQPKFTAVVAPQTPDVPRPGSVPASASKSPVTVKPLVADNVEIGTLTISIDRPAVNH